MIAIVRGLLCVPTSNSKLPVSRAASTLVGCELTGLTA